MIKEYILDVEVPKKVKWSNRKKYDDINSVSKEDILQQMLEKMTISTDLMTQLLSALQASTRKETLHEQGQIGTKSSRDREDQFLRLIQRLLIKQIREKKVDYELWDAYTFLLKDIKESDEI